jgi:uncharacterized protein (TIGR02145 family)
LAMSKIITFIAFFVILASGLYAQLQTIELTLTAEYNGAYTRLDSVRVMNRTHWGITVIYWPDTSLSLEINPGDLLLLIGYATGTVGVQDMPDPASSFEVRQNHPNPMGDRSEISMYIPLEGTVNLMITDAQGKVVLRTDRQLDRGHHTFRFLPGGSNVYFLTAYWNGMTRSIKMISTGSDEGKRCGLEYLGARSGEPALKSSLLVDYYPVRQSGIVDAPEDNTTYHFQFVTRIPCPGMPTVDYGGQVYNTIQIFSQCWLKENLNVGQMINGVIDQADNGTIEKYCNNNEPDSCTKYGGYYQWWEVMQYTTRQGARGICPPGWHVPMDDEWKVLEGAVDSEYGIGHPIWDFPDEGSHGYDAGTNLKTTSGWYANGNGLDPFGFSALPGGYFSHGIGTSASWWTSTEKDSAYTWGHALNDWQPIVYTGSMFKERGYSVRCLRD